MKRTHFHRVLSILLVCCLVVAVALPLSGCGAESGKALYKKLALSTQLSTAAQNATEYQSFEAEVSVSLGSMISSQLGDAAITELLNSMKLKFAGGKMDDTRVGLTAALGNGQSDWLTLSAMLQGDDAFITIPALVDKALKLSSEEFSAQTSDIPSDAKAYATLVQNTENAFVDAIPDDCFATLEQVEIHSVKMRGVTVTLDKAQLTAALIAAVKVATSDPTFIALYKQIAAQEDSVPDLDKITTDAEKEIADALSSFDGELVYTTYYTGDKDVVGREIAVSGDDVGGAFFINAYDKKTNIGVIEAYVWTEERDNRDASMRGDYQCDGKALNGSVVLHMGEESFAITYNVPDIKVKSTLGLPYGKVAYTGGSDILPACSVEMKAGEGSDVLVLDVTNFLKATINVKPVAQAFTMPEINTSDVYTAADLSTNQELQTQLMANLAQLAQGELAPLLGMFISGMMPSALQ